MYFFLYIYICIYIYQELTRYDPKETNHEHPKYIVGREHVIKNGGVVKTIGLVEGFSTTNLIHKLKS